eukprot:scaffold1311_cov256-Pinguiococcus_pyrenoidosus.AAC.3
MKFGRGLLPTQRNEVCVCLVLHVKAAAARSNHGTAGLFRVVLDVEDATGERVSVVAGDVVDDARTRLEAHVHVLPVRTEGEAGLRMVERQAELAAQLRDEAEAFLQRSSYRLGIESWAVEDGEEVALVVSAVHLALAATIFAEVQDVVLAAEQELDLVGLVVEGAGHGGRAREGAGVEVERYEHLVALRHEVHLAIAVVDAFRAAEVAARGSGAHTVAGRPREGAALRLRVEGQDLQILGHAAAVVQAVTAFHCSAEADQRARGVVDGHKPLLWERPVVVGHGLEVLAAGAQERLPGIGGGTVGTRLPHLSSAPLFAGQPGVPRRLAAAAVPRGATEDAAVVHDLPSSVEVDGPHAAAKGALRVGHIGPAAGARRVGEARAGVRQAVEPAAAATRVEVHALAGGGDPLGRQAGGQQQIAAVRGHAELSGDVGERAARHRRRRRRGRLLHRRRRRLLRRRRGRLLRRRRQQRGRAGRAGDGGNRRGGRRRGGRSWAGSRRGGLRRRRRSAAEAGAAEAAAAGVEQVEAEAVVAVRCRRGRSKQQQ